jgi:hypothetical protein
MKFDDEEIREKACCLLEVCRVAYLVDEATKTDSPLVDWVNNMVFQAADWLEIPYEKYNADFAASDYITDFFDRFAHGVTIEAWQLLRAWQFTFHCFEKFNREPDMEDLQEMFDGFAAEIAEAKLENTRKGSR